MSDLTKSSGDGAVNASSGEQSLEVSRRQDKVPAGMSARTGASSLQVHVAESGRVPLRGRPLPQSQRLPNASIIYGIGASVLFVLALGLLFNGLWLTALIVMLAAASFLGFAVHYIRVDSTDGKPYG